MMKSANDKCELWQMKVIEKKRRALTECLDQVEQQRYISKLIP